MVRAESRAARNSENGSPEGILVMDAISMAEIRIRIGQVQQREEINEGTGER